MKGKTRDESINNAGSRQNIQNLKSEKSNNRRGEWKGERFLKWTKTARL